MGELMERTYPLGLILVLMATVVTADESFPYQVAVKARDVTARSGPGAQYYATGHLARGDEIHVHSRDAAGWLAIRPPVGSFNWVEAKKLRMTDDPDLAKVVGSNAVAWVGSQLGAIEDHKWQVKLNAGESVQLMSRQSLAIYSGDEPRDFYQIAPPAGEFRWVHEHDIEPIVEQAAAADAPTEVQLAQFRVVVNEPVEDSTVRDGFVARDDSVTSTRTPAARVASLPPRASFRPSEANLEDFASLVKQIDVELAETVSQEPSQWKLASLRLDAEALVEQSETTLHRGTARLLLEKIKEFEKLQLRYAGIDGLEPAGPPSDSGAESRPGDAESLSDFDPRFDGRGWLLPVHSSRQASPPYALLDQQGQILKFISPAPGLNLHRYLRKEVGIFGQRSRAEFLNKPHLTADRIVDIGRHRR